MYKFHDYGFRNQCNGKLFAASDPFLNRLGVPLKGDGEKSNGMNETLPSDQH